MRRWQEVAERLIAQDLAEADPGPGEPAAPRRRRPLGLGGLRALPDEPGAPGRVWSSGSSPSPAPDGRTPPSNRFAAPHEHDDDDPTPLLRGRDPAQHRRRRPRPAAPTEPRRALGVRAGGGRHHPAEYVLLEHYMDRITPERQARIGTYLRRIQGEHGGWRCSMPGPSTSRPAVKAIAPSRPSATIRRRPTWCGPVAPSSTMAGPSAPTSSPHPAGAVRRPAVARRAGDAGRDHAPAPLVRLQHLGDVVLGPYLRGAAPRAPGGEAARPQPRAA